MVDLGVTLGDVYRARKRIQGVASNTPLIESDSASQVSGTKVYMKLENTQQTGSFKIRGATNKLLSLLENERPAGVITVSSGNHGKATAYVARMLNIPAVIGLGVKVPENKVRSIRAYGAEPLIVGDSYEETLEHAEVLREERGLTYINPFDDPFVIAGQGTMVPEILERNPDIDMFVVPLSGGGLAGGIAIAAKSIDPYMRVIGVSQEGSPVMYHSIRAGKEIEMEEVPTIADALLGGIGPDNQYTFEICRTLLDETVLVSEEEIAAAMAFMLEEHHQVVEGAGAVGVAALLNQRARFGKNTAVIISGGSLDTSLLVQIAQKYILKKESTK
jgi:threonine dehydratase